METRAVDTIASKSDYANLCVYVKRVESINLAQLYRALTSYLSILTLPDAEHYLGVYQEHLTDSYSWLTKAQCLSQAEAQRDFARSQVEAAGSTQDRVLWEDAEKKLNYLIEGWDADKSTACQQIVHGISMLINENIPLSEVHAEIIEFAQGRDVAPPEAAAEYEVIQRLKHLLHDAWVNSVTTLVKLARTVAVQADLFLNRVTQAAVDFENLESRQAFLLQANYALCELIETQKEGLSGCLDYLPTTLSARMMNRLDKISVTAIFDRYKEYAQLDDVYCEENYQPVTEKKEPYVEAFEETAEVKDKFQYEEKVAPVPEATNDFVSIATLERLLDSCEQLLESVIKQISLHRLQLSCSSRAKACYGKFVLFPLFRQVSAKLTHYQKMLMDSLSELSAASNVADVSEEWVQKLQAINQALEHSLARVGTYLKALNIQHKDYSVTEEIPSWQSKLHDLILGSSEEELALVDSRLQRIETMDSPYLRATLLMKLDSAKLKLNDMIFANMQSWSSRFVDRETVIHTLGYLGIRIHPAHLNKIAPNISVSKRRAVKKKYFYSGIADYSMTTFRNVRAWLDKRVIN